MYNRILNHKSLKLFDVTLRDGLQSISKIYSFKEKQEIFEDIIFKRNVTSIEIGSIVNPKILPQMKDSLELYNYAHCISLIIPKPMDIYMLTPNCKSLETAIDNKIENFSFITSVSDEFQKRNINRSLNESKNEIKNMMKMASNVDDSKVKLYISCITECPISGQINKNRIVDEIMYYFYTHEYINEICLSDTCGSLKFNDFKFILSRLISRNIDVDKLSLHLHDQNDKNNLDNIIIYAINNDITKFDVSSMPEIGGCSVTMKKMQGNLSYEQIYKFL